MFPAHTYRVRCVNTSTGNSTYYCSNWYIHTATHYFFASFKHRIMYDFSSPLQIYWKFITEFPIASDAGKCSHKISLFHDRFGLFSCGKCIQVFHEKFALRIFVLAIINTLMTRAYCCVFAHRNNTPV